MSSGSQASQQAQSNQQDASTAFINAQLAAVGGVIPNIAAEKTAKKRAQNEKYRVRAQNTAGLAIPPASGTPSAPAPTAAAGAQSGSKKRRRRAKAPKSANKDGETPDPDPEADGSGTAPPPKKRRRAARKTPPQAEEQPDEDTGSSQEVAAPSLDRASDRQRADSDAPTATNSSGTVTPEDNEMADDEEFERLLAEAMLEA